MKVLVAGSNGYVGRHIVRLFRSKGFDVYTYQRESSNLEADINSVKQTSSEMYDQFGIVINCARPHWSEFNGQQILAIEQKLFSDLNEFASKGALKIHTSGIWLFGTASEKDLVEFNFKPFDSVKLDVETLEKALSSNWHIVYCPSIIYGGECCQLKRIIEEKSNSEIEVATPSTGYNQYVHVLDVANYYLFLAQNPSVTERQHFIAEPKGYSPEQFADLLVTHCVIQKTVRVSWQDFEEKYDASHVDIEKLSLDLPISQYFSASHKIAEYVAQYT
ncbi:sugar nucleotide-binding protein [Vibrio sp. Isolate31]|uniref:NAD-dependent epimerase/dehydratase family protein n=1 Tax=unclassified Vibrio TaxID=2614977 RepID=UPI001EFDAEB1|nr:MULTISPECIES: NAD-dependent epimerase/dehydratase family protein [unclassified Vibrio]MCG9553284.1 sugar nucleotide-binding protein [Vibrio sp. Isolate32]MCG9600265.1 sugar nucleotide-binding protein [Vibrio sp. Isolate31]